MAAPSLLGRVGGLGTTAGLVALVAWPFFAAWSEPLQIAFAAAAAVAGLCGAAMLLLTLSDLLFHRKRSRKL